MPRPTILPLSPARRLGLALLVLALVVGVHIGLPALQEAGRRPAAAAGVAAAGEKRHAS
jgi:hypothetical protein